MASDHPNINAPKVAEIDLESQQPASHAVLVHEQSQQPASHAVLVHEPVNKRNGISWEPWLAAAIVACFLGLLIFGIVWLSRSDLSVSILPRSEGQRQADSRRALFEGGSDGYANYRIPALIKFGEYVIAFAEGRVNGADDHGHIHIVSKISEDGGNSFGALSRVVHVDEWTTCGDPVPLVTGKGDLLLVFTVNNTFVRTTRTSDGRVWSAPTDITSSVKKRGWGWMATGPGHGFVTRSGRIIVPYNHYLEEATIQQTTTLKRGPSNVAIQDASIAFEITNRHDLTEKHQTRTVDLPLPGKERHNWHLETLNPFIGRANQAGVLYSDDDGDTWQIGGDVPLLGSSECVVEEQKNGDLLISYRYEPAFSDLGRALAGIDDRCRLFSTSSDGGETWSTPYQPKGCIPDPRCQASLLRSGDMLLTSNPNHETERKAMSIWASTDEGQTFSLLEELTDWNDGLAGYSDLVGLQQSEVGVAYETDGYRNIVFQILQAPQ